ncbi:hypothetical protein BDR03DRAFT_1002577 [Suillus americanus]|nr:hypothetical protein BDR03DRAFT_1002577 [Suillus americanus]
MQSSMSKNASDPTRLVDYAYPSGLVNFKSCIIFTPEHFFKPYQVDYNIATIRAPQTNSVPDPLDDTLEALVSSQVLNNPKTQDRHTSLECNKSSLLVSIRATDLTLGLRRIPAGFHVVVKADGTECQISNKLVHVDQAVAEWNEPIHLHNILAQAGGSRIPVFMRVRSDFLTKTMPQFFAPLLPTQNSTRDLNQSINHFEHALDICPMDPPFSLAAAKVLLIYIPLVIQTDPSPNIVLLHETGISDGF